MATLTELGILTGDNSPVNINKFVTAVLNNKLSSEAIHAFVSASQGGLDKINQSLQEVLAQNTSLSEKTQSQIKDIIMNASHKELTPSMLERQLWQINQLVDLQKHTQKMNFLNYALGAFVVMIIIYFVYLLISSIINWFGIILLVIVMGGLLIFAAKRFLI